VTTYKTPMDSLAEIWSRRKWLLILPFVLLFCVLASLIYALPPLFKASTTVIFGQDDIAESYVTNTTRNELEQRLEVVRQSILSRSHLQEFIEEFNLYPQLRRVLAPEAVVNRMRKDIEIRHEMLRQPQWGQNSTFAVSIAYQGWEPELVARVTNELAIRYQQEHEGIRTRQATRTAAFLREQLEEVRGRFLEQERRIDEFKIANLGGLPQQEGMNLATLERLNSEMRLNGERQIQLMSRRNDLLLGLGDANSNAVTGASNVVRLERLKRDLADMGTRYTDNYPDIIRVRNQIMTLEKEIAGANASEGTKTALPVGFQGMIQSPEEMENEIVRLRIKEEELREAFTSLQRRVENTPRVEQELQQLTNDYNEIRELYLSLQKRYQDASLAETLEFEQNQRVQVLEYAIPPDFPAAPDRMRLLIMLLVVSAGLSVGLVFIAEQTDRTFHTIDDVRNFTKLPVLGSISHIRTTKDKVNVGLRFMIIASAFILGVIVLSVLAYNYGQTNGQTLMWMMN
jgi:polysaccharide biosynthesis transport protein